MSEDQRAFFMYEDHLYPTRELLRERYKIDHGYLKWRCLDHGNKKRGSLGHYVNVKFFPHSRTRSYLHRDLINIYVTGHVHPRFPVQELLTMYESHK